MSKKNKTATVKTQLSKKQIRELNAAMDEALKVCAYRDDDPTRLEGDICAEFKVANIYQLQPDRLPQVASWLVVVWPSVDLKRRLTKHWREAREMLEQLQWQIQVAKSTITR